ncbi:potassium-transporting ATPase subunit KdpC [Occallatibacter savannae]|uniref:potassium-transporting ATPase subunit KdpC n=1 Tax=Occallatibacter savannae TaxID=1002691 RepID=UPI000D690135|nr:potassium-transporting ATPase subunit KdpC [Occallatibacter savannae]
MTTTATLPVPAHAHEAQTAEHSVWATSIRFTLLTTLLFGIAYPLVLTGVAGAVFPHRAAGSLIERNGQVIGSELLAQGFASDKYFHPRPSAAGNGYDATSSGGSNYAQSNAKLVQRMQGDIDKLAAENPGRPVPIDAVTTSGSGLDPDITPDNALFQARRVAKARGLSEEQLKQLISQHTQARTFGLLGEPRVNVLELNLALDQLAK